MSETYSLEDMVLVVRYAKAQRLRWALYGFIAGVLVAEALILGGWLR
jgi:hypothetical protein